MPQINAMKIELNLLSSKRKPNVGQNKKINLGFIVSLAKMVCISELLNSLS